MCTQQPSFDPRAQRVNHLTLIRAHCIVQNHDSTHRVCAKLVESASDSTPLSWGPAGDFWQITGQKAFQWNDKIVSAPNPGDSWCICMWATASLIEKVGCENVHLRCEATDVKYVLSSYHDGGHSLDAAHACIRQKCLSSTTGRGARRFQGYAGFKSQEL